MRSGVPAAAPGRDRTPGPVRIDTTAAHLGADARWSEPPADGRVARLSPLAWLSRPRWSVPPSARRRCS